MVFAQNANAAFLGSRALSAVEGPQSSPID